jgi:hypothetical protein
MNDPIWLIDSYLDGELTTEDAAALRAWLQADPARVDAMVRQSHLHWQLREAMVAERSRTEALRLAELSTPADAWASPPPVVPAVAARPRARPALFWTVTAAAVAILLLAAGLYWASPRNRPTPLETIAQQPASPPESVPHPSEPSVPAGKDPTVPLPDEKVRAGSGNARAAEPSRASQPTGNRKSPLAEGVPVTPRAQVPAPKPTIAQTPAVDSSPRPRQPAPAAAKIVERPVKASPASLVREALVAEALGDRARSEVAIGKALAMEPGYAPAKWLAGCLRWEGRWLGWEEVQRKVQADSRLAEYRKLRDAQAASPLGQLALARWCQSRGLLSEARVHWMYVLQAQPQNAEALKCLGVQWWQGELLTEAQIRQRKQASPESMAKEDGRWTSHWERRLTGWRRALERGESTLHTEILAEFASAQGPVPLHTLGTLLMVRSQRKPEQGGYRTLSLDLVRYLAVSKEPWAPAQLVRHAVDHPTPEVREAAADALKDRPKETYVPYLLWRMQMPIEARFSIVSLGGRGVVYQMSLEREGPDANYVQTRTFSIVAAPQTLRMRDPRDGQPSDSFQAAAAQAAMRSRQAHLRAAEALADAKQRVDVASANAAWVNQRVRTVLCHAVGGEFSDDPVACQRWWADYCRDYYELGESYYSSEDETSGTTKPVREELSFVSFRVPSGHSCFHRDTPVWTSAGKMPIQQIRPGDCVLSKHPRSGELAYKPVLNVTLRKPAPMLKVGFGHDTIVATAGHPFWVCGEGWKMAKQLKVGMRVLALAGTVLVDGLEEVPAPGPWYEQLKERPDAQPEDVAAYNLAVDDFHTYFVGEQKLLVHDVVLFPLDGPLSGMPGL